MTRASPVLSIWRTWQARGLPPLLPLLVVGLLVFCAMFAPLLAPHSPNEGSLGKRLIPPLGMEGSTLEHVLGTDRLGRDTLSRLLYGAQISLSVSLVGILLTPVQSVRVSGCWRAFGVPGWTRSACASWTSRCRCPAS
jgi:ABC-type dipeptide/oligopeptide/nickel transport system permease subunit